MPMRRLEYYASGWWNKGISAEKIYDFATATRLLTELVADFSDQLADVRMVRPLPLANVLARLPMATDVSSSAASI